MGSNSSRGAASPPFARSPFASPGLALCLLATLAAAPCSSGQQRQAPADAEQQSETELTGRRVGAVEMGAGGLVAPLQISTDLPEYTEAAEQAGIDGDVYIEAVVTKEGTVVEPELIRGLADDELNRRALEAITRWRFKPGMRDNEPVDVIALFTVTFRVHRAQ